MIYTLWRDGGGDLTLVEGADPPRFADGTPQDPAHVLVATFEAESWAEALTAARTFLAKA